MAEKKGGRPSYEGVIHTWKVPADVVSYCQCVE